MAPADDSVANTTTKVVDALNALPGVQAKKILASAETNPPSSGATASISVDLSIVYDGARSSPWCGPPQILTNEPITADIIQQICQAGQQVKIEELVLIRGIDENIQAVHDLLLALSEHQQSKSSSSSSSLRRITLQMFHATDETARIVFTRFPMLTHVDVSQCRNFTNAAFSHMAPSLGDSLQTLNLQSTGIDDDGLLQLATTLTNLQQLVISYTNVTTLQPLSRLERLEKLEWLANRTSAETNVVSLEALHHGFDALKCLEFGANVVTDEHVICAASCANLQTLKLRAMGGTTEITDSGLAAIGKNLPQLQTLSIHGSAAITDAGVAHLQFLQNLVYLDLGRSHKLTEKSMETFAQLPKLRVLDIAHARNIISSPAPLDRLQKANPHVNIIIGYMMDVSKSQGAMVYGKEQSGFDFTPYLS